jgi:ATP phosphoribosyltransferase regulatory subunit
VKPRSSIAPIPPGALDLAGDAVRRRRQLQSRMLERLETAGYQEIIPPTFEYAEVFVRAGGEGQEWGGGGGGGPDLADRLIRFLDLDGKLLALRYDFTASVARLAATKLADQPPPLRLCYAGKVFRQDPGREGRRPREILQVGGELLGADGVSADVEILRLALALARCADAREFQVNVGHVGALAPALAELESQKRAVVRRLIDRKDAAGLAAAAPGVLTELPFIIGRREALDRAAQVMADVADPNEGVTRLRAVDAALTDDEREHVVYDFGEVRGLDYYTGIHFEIFVAGARTAVGAGGRYDDLMARFGRPLPAVGLALDLDALAEAVQ